MSMPHHPCDVESNNVHVKISFLFAFCFLALFAASAFGIESKLQLNDKLQQLAKTHGLDELFGPSGQCTCTVTACSCCVDKIPLLNSICANLTWDAQTLTVGISFSINGVVVYSGSFHDSHSLDGCFTDLCTVCLSLNNLNVTDTGACGQIYFNVTCFSFSTAWDMGTFHLGTDCTVPAYSQFIQAVWDAKQKLMKLNSPKPVTITDHSTFKDPIKNARVVKIRN